MIWANLNGVELMRGEQNNVAALMKSLLVMDSKGFFDACTRQESAQLGMKSAKDGIEALAVHDATQPESNCTPTWCPGDLNLADMLTKGVTRAVSESLLPALIGRKKECPAYDGERPSSRSLGVGILTW